MAETLVELVAKIKADATELGKDLSDAEKQTEVSSKKMADSLHKVGIAMAASGAAIIATLSLMGKAAIDEEINVKHLQVALKGVGIEYDTVEDSLEGVIAATQRKTGIADSEQRDVLSQLILVTKDYTKAQKLLPMALDLAAYSSMDATSAATYLGKAYEELEAGADKIGIRMGTTTVYFKDLDEVQRMVGGTAEAMKNPFSVLAATISDLSETIGANLIPIIKDAVDWIVDISEKIQVWTKENPELARVLTLVSLAVGAVLTVVGGLILAMPVITSMVAAFGVVFHVALGPIGLISLAIAGLITVGILLWQNWDKITMFFREAWINIKQFFLEGVLSILNSLSNFTKFIPGLNSLVDSARDKIANMIEATKIEEDSLRAEKALKDVSEALEDTTEIIKENTDATKEQTEAAKENAKILKEQENQLLTLTEQLRKTRREYEYTRSDAGRLRITLDDVKYALFDQGKTIDDLLPILAALGDDAEDVNKVMETFGLTAQRVKEILDAQKESVGALGDAYKKVTYKAPEITPEQAARGAHMVTYTQDQLAGIARSMALDGATPTQIASSMEILAAGQPSYASGGIVTQPTMAMVGEAGPEAIIPLNEAIGGGITINFTQPVFFDREDTMNKFVDMIRKGIQRQDRLRFGGAYNGG